MRMGYYIAKMAGRCRSARRGPGDLSLPAMLIWRALHRRAGSAFDGVSVVEKPDGTTDILIIQDNVTKAYRG